MWRSQNRWSFHSENDRPLHPLLLSRAYNILTDRKDIIKPIGFHRESTALNDTDMKYLLLYLEETYGLTNKAKV